MTTSLKDMGVGRLKKLYTEEIESDPTSTTSGVTIVSQGKIDIVPNVSGGNDATRTNPVPATDAAGNAAAERVTTNFTLAQAGVPTETRQAHTYSADAVTVMSKKGLGATPTTNAAATAANVSAFPTGTQSYEISFNISYNGVPVSGAVTVRRLFSYGTLICNWYGDGKIEATAGGVTLATPVNTLAMAASTQKKYKVTMRRTYVDAPLNSLSTFEIFVDGVQKSVSTGTGLATHSLSSPALVLGNDGTGYLVPLTFDDVRIELGASTESNMWTLATNGTATTGSAVLTYASTPTGAASHTGGYFQTNYGNGTVTVSYYSATNIGRATGGYEILVTGIVKPFTSLSTATGGDVGTGAGAAMTAPFLCGVANSTNTNANMAELLTIGKDGTAGSYVSVWAWRGGRLLMFTGNHYTETAGIVVGASEFVLGVLLSSSGPVLYVNGAPATMTTAGWRTITANASFTGVTGVSLSATGTERGIYLGARSPYQTATPPATSPNPFNIGFKNWRVVDTLAAGGATPTMTSPQIMYTQLYRYADEYDSEPLMVTYGFRIGDDETLQIVKTQGSATTTTLLGNPMPASDNISGTALDGNSMGTVEDGTVNVVLELLNKGADPDTKIVVRPTTSEKTAVSAQSETSQPHSYSDNAVAISGAKRTSAASGGNLWITGDTAVAGSCVAVEQVKFVDSSVSTSNPTLLVSSAATVRVDKDLVLRSTDRDGGKIGTTRGDLFLNPASGAVKVKGTVQVDGELSSANTSTANVTVLDKTLVLSNATTTNADADGAGIVVEGDGAVNGKSAERSLRWRKNAGQERGDETGSYWHVRGGRRCCRGGSTRGGGRRPGPT
eukprot:jgi/Mesvir1/22118/Mv18721-RA.1